MQFETVSSPSKITDEVKDVDVKAESSFISNVNNTEVDQNSPVVKKKRRTNLIVGTSEKETGTSVEFVTTNTIGENFANTLKTDDKLHYKDYHDISLQSSSEELHKMENVDLKLISSNFDILLGNELGSNYILNSDETEFMRERAPDTLSNEDNLYVNNSSKNVSPEVSTWPTECRGSNNNENAHILNNIEEVANEDLISSTQQCNNSLTINTADDGVNVTNLNNSDKKNSFFFINVVINYFQIFTFRNYISVFQNELDSVDYKDSNDLKNERVKNFLLIPNEIEKVSIGKNIAEFYIFLYFLVPFSSSHKVDIVKGLLLLSGIYLVHSLDASIIYHSIRGQSVLKLYVIFNVLEICDKLCSALGHDILDSLFSPSTAPNRKKKVNFLTNFVIAIFYNYIHTVVLFYHMMTLNVAINSYSTSLLSLMLSNQFVEIKSSVFKKFERENLFQLSCSDVIERFQLSIYLILITLRNYIELTGGDGIKNMFAFIWNLLNLEENFFFGIYSIFNLSSFKLLLENFFTVENFNKIKFLVTPGLLVLITEVIVDWLKHAFITKFNLIKPNIYTKFRDSLCRDLCYRGDEGKGQKKSHQFVARRVGFISLPICCLIVRVLFQTIEMLGLPRILNFEAVFLNSELINELLHLNFTILKLRIFNVPYLMLLIFKLSVVIFLNKISQNRLLQAEKEKKAFEKTREDETINGEKSYSLLKPKVSVSNLNSSSEQTPHSKIPAYTPSTGSNSPIKDLTFNYFNLKTKASEENILKDENRFDNIERFTLIKRII
ncbi:hypothetical protein HK099_006892 [Clydaea vesicula]|uniref:Uncharacterized protein n=1 Tax=Clydaea vesicula TaxID=447962 RepID=A0AAD5U1Z7_9FUNG|nr:hypothetical protein HK099_006892 [Clydaea vesicula]